MSEWKRVKLGEVAKMMRGKAVTRSSIAPGNIPVMLGGREPAYYCNESNHTGPCFIVSRSGASAGYVSYWDEPIFVTDGFLFDADSKSDTQFLYYSLKARQESLIMSQNGTGIPHVRGEDLKNIELEFPTAAERNRIAAILSNYDSAIDNARRQIALLEEAAMRLYREWFCSKSVMETSIASLGEYMNGYAFKPSDFMGEGMPILKIREMQNGVSDSTPRNNGKNIPDKYQVFPGDIVFSWSATLDVVYWSGEVALLNQHLFKVTPREEYSIPFVYGAIKSSLETFRNLAHGATMQHIQRGKLDEVKVYCPTAGELTAYNEIAVPLYEKLMQEKALIHCLTEARDRLLPKLMSGEVSV